MAKQMLLIKASKISKPTIINHPAPLEDPKLSKTVSMLNTKIAELTHRLEAAQDELTSIKQSTPTEKIKYISSPPEIIRIQDPPIVEIKYEQDPMLQERVEKLKLELSLSLKHEQEAKDKLRSYIKEVSILNTKLQNQNNENSGAAVIYKEKKIGVIKEVQIRIGDKIEFLMQKYDRHKDHTIKTAIFWALYHFKNSQKLKKKLAEKKEKIIVNQKLEVVDGTFAVWETLQKGLCKWLLRIFIDVADQASRRKMYSSI